LPKKVAAALPLPAQPEEILFRVEGKCPLLVDRTISEWLRTKTLPTKADLQNPKCAYLFCRPRPLEPSGLGRRLNPINIIRLSLELCRDTEGIFAGAHSRVWKIPRMACSQAAFWFHEKMIASFLSRL
jgi:hypothetical protein